MRGNVERSVLQGCLLFSQLGNVFSKLVEHRIDLLGHAHFVDKGRLKLRKICLYCRKLRVKLFADLFEFSGELSDLHQSLLVLHLGVLLELLDLCEQSLVQRLNLTFKRCSDVAYLLFQVTGIAHACTFHSIHFILDGGSANEPDLVLKRLKSAFNIDLSQLGSQSAQVVALQLRVLLQGLDCGLLLVKAAFQVRQRALNLRHASIIGFQLFSQIVDVLMEFLVTDELRRELGFQMRELQLQGVLLLLQLLLQTLLGCLIVLSQQGLAVCLGLKQHGFEFVLQLTELRIQLARVPVWIFLLRLNELGMLRDLAHKVINLGLSLVLDALIVALGCLHLDQSLVEVGKLIAHFTDRSLCLVPV